MPPLWSLTGFTASFIINQHSTGFQMIYGLDLSVNFSQFTAGYHCCTFQFVSRPTFQQQEWICRQMFVLFIFILLTSSHPAKPLSFVRPPGPGLGLGFPFPPDLPGSWCTPSGENQLVTGQLVTGTGYYYRPRPCCSGAEPECIPLAYLISPPQSICHCWLRASRLRARNVPLQLTRWEAFEKSQ